MRLYITEKGAEKLRGQLKLVNKLELLFGHNNINIPYVREYRPQFEMDLTEI